MHTKTKCILFGRMLTDNDQRLQQKPDAKSTFEKEIPQNFDYDVLCPSWAQDTFGGLLLLGANNVIKFKISVTEPSVRKKNAEILENSS